MYSKLARLFEVHRLDLLWFPLNLPLKHDTLAWCLMDYGKYGRSDMFVLLCSWRNIPLNVL